MKDENRCIYTDLKLYTNMTDTSSQFAGYKIILHEEPKMFSNSLLGSLCNDCNMTDSEGILSSKSFFTHKPIVFCIRPRGERCCGPLDQSQRDDPSVKPRPLRTERGFARFFTVRAPAQHKPWFFIQNELLYRKTKRHRPRRLPRVRKLTHLKMMAGCWLEECKREGKNRCSKRRGWW